MSNNVYLIKTYAQNYQSNIYYNIAYAIYICLCRTYLKQVFFDIFKDKLVANLGKSKASFPTHLHTSKHTTPDDA